MRTRSTVVGVLLAICWLTSLAAADSLELKNGSRINGTYLGGTETDISFRVGSTVQHYNVADVVTVTFDSKRDTAVYDQPNKQRGTLTPNPQLVDRTQEDSQQASRVQEGRMQSDRRDNEHPMTNRPRSSSGYVTVPAGTQISVRMIDSIDSDKNRVGDKFQASLEEDLVADGGGVIATRGTDVYGRLSEAKDAGHISGRSELKLELTGIMINGRTVPLVTGEYQLQGNSRGGNTAKKAAGGAALGAIIGAVAGGGKGAAIGAGVGAGAGTSINVITKGEQVKIPSETLLDFTLQQSLNVDAPR